MPRRGAAVVLVTQPGCGGSGDSRPSLTTTSLGWPNAGVTFDQIAKVRVVLSDREQYAAPLAGRLRQMDAPSGPAPR